MSWLRLSGSPTRSSPIGATCCRSVERIMNAGLEEAATVGALTLFRSSLSVAGDPHRDPRVAIDASTTPDDAVGE
jgi:hypothetical protein